MLLVAVHAGAGFHAHSKHAALRATMDRACRAAITCADGMQACVAAIRVLEDCPLTNAGIGSCLTWDGTVECDASVMSGRSGDFGAVGCLAHTQHPIEVAHALWMQRTRGRLSLERVPPMILAGTAAHDFAAQHAPAAAAHPASCAAASAFATDSATAASSSTAAASSASCPLLTEASTRKWQSYSRSLREHEAQSRGDASGAAPPAAAASPSPTIAADQLSTVGAIVVALNGDVFAGVSSGGIWMKAPGRIGHAAAFGAGCSAYNPSRDRAGAAVSISGTGEQIMERLLSFSIAQQMRQTVKTPVTAVAAATSGKRKNVSAHSQSKRQRLPAGAAADTEDSSSTEDEEEEPDDSDSLDSILRRALQDEQPAAFDTTPPAGSHKREALAAGVIALQVSALSPSSAVARAPLCVELLWGHSTPHFAVGYLARDQTAPASFISAATDPSDVAAAAPAAAASRPAAVVVAGQRFRFAI